MPIEAVIFGIGDVLEVNPRTGWRERWAKRLLMDAASFEGRLDEIWGPGSIGNPSLEEIERQTAAAFDLGPAALTALMDDAWSAYVGTLNQQLADYFAVSAPAIRRES